MATNNSTAPTPEQFQASFPNPAIPKIEGKPDYESLDALRSLLVENAASVSTTLGGGLFGHSGMVLSPAAYELVAPDTPYVPPPNPWVVARKRVAPGATRPYQSNSLWLWTTSPSTVQYIQKEHIEALFAILRENTKPSRWIRVPPYSAESHVTGITKIAPVTFPCPVTLTLPSKNLATQNRAVHRIRHTDTMIPTTAQKSKNQKCSTSPHLSTKTPSNASRIGFVWSLKAGQPVKLVKRQKLV